MMEAKELRIGNLVYYSEGDSYLKMTKEIMREAFAYDEFLYYEPIPLTEHWLERFSFKLSPSIVYYNGNFGIDKQGKKWYVVLREKNLKSTRFTAISEVKYVHQLQNLYFALTGKELTIE